MKRAGNLLVQARRFMLPLMAGLLGLYVALHSPLRGLIASVFWMKPCFSVLSLFPLHQTIDSLAALALIAIALVAAWMVADTFDGTSYERPLTLGLCALAFIVVPAAAIGAIAEQTGTTLLRPPLGPLFAAVPSAIFVAIAVKRGWRLHWPSLKLPRPGGLVLVVGLVAVTLLLGSVGLSLLHPATGFDALAYHAPLATFLWRDGNLGAFLDRAPGNWPLAHPGTAELWSGLLLVAGGEPLADLGQLAFTFLGSAAVHAFARRLGLRHGSAMLAASGFLLAPMVVMQSGMQLNDVVGAGLLMATMAIASAPVSTWGRRRLALLGLGMGLVATTKLALLPCVAGVGAFVIGAMLWQDFRRIHIRSVAAKLVLIAVTLLIVAAPWWIRNVARYGNPLFPADLPLLGRGVPDSSKADAAFLPTPVLWPLYPLLEKHDEQSGVGALFVISVVPGLLLAALRGRRSPLLLYLVVTVVTLPAWWILTPHFPRFLLAIVGLTFAFLPWSLLALPRRQRNVGALLIASTAIFSSLVTYGQALLPFAQQPTSRTEFYDRVWGVDQVVTALSESDGILFDTGYAGTPVYPAYYPLLGPARSRTVIPVDTGGTTESIIAQMRGAGIRYAYVMAAPENRAVVEALYDRSLFEPVHVSTVVAGERSGARRHLYRLATGDEERTGMRRYLYRLWR